MKLNFQKTIVLKMEHVVGNVSAFVLSELKRIYEKKCLEDYFVVKIIEIIERSKLMAPNNEYETDNLLCNVIFLAECRKFEKNEIMAVKADSVANNICKCKTDSYELAVKLGNINIKEGDIFLIYIVGVDYLTGKPVSLIGQVFLPKYISTTIDKIFYANDSDILKEEIKLVQEKIKNIKETPLMKKLKDIISDNKKSKFKYEKHSVYDIDKLKPTNEIISYICSARDCLFDGIFYIGPVFSIEKNNKELEVDGIFKLNTKGHSIYKSISEQLNIIYTVLKAIEEWAELIGNEEAFKKNKNVWKIYEF